MTYIIIALTIALQLLLLAVSFAHHSRKWDAMTDEEKAKDIEQEIW